MGRSDLLADVDAFVERLDGEISELERARAALDAELNELRGLRRRLRPPQAKPKPKPARAAPLSKQGRMMIGVIEAQEFFSAPDIIAATGVSEPTTYKLLRILREQEIIGKAHRKNVDNASMPRQYYRVLDAGALARMRDGAS